MPFDITSPGAAYSLVGAPGTQTPSVSDTYRFSTISHPFQMLTDHPPVIRQVGQAPVSSLIYFNGPQLNQPFVFPARSLSEAEQKRDQEWKAYLKEMKTRWALEQLLSMSNAKVVSILKHKILNQLEKGETLEAAIQSLSDEDLKKLAKALFRQKQKGFENNVAGMGELFGLLGKFITYEPSYEERLSYLLPDDESDYGQGHATGVKKLLNLLESGQNFNTILKENKELGVSELMQFCSLCTEQIAMLHSNPLDPMVIYCELMRDMALAAIAETMKPKAQSEEENDTEPDSEPESEPEPKSEGGSNATPQADSVTAPGVAKPKSIKPGGQEPEES